MITKLINKNIFLRANAQVLEIKLNKSRKSENKALSELKEMQENNVFLIDENDMLKSQLRKYQAKEDKANGKKLKKKLDKEMEHGNNK